jgi:hypothetical protein
MSKPAKHGSCISHPKLPCGCKVCATPQSTAITDLDGLTAFHAEIHAIVAARRARPRHTGTGTPVDLLDPWTGEVWRTA